jgi:APA family basic amino acid/polyamine antiporter
MKMHRAHQTGNEPHEELARKLNVFDTSMILAGIVIGSGIFLSTGIMAKTLPSAGWILIAWLVGGLISLAGALTVAELGASMPEAGGLYVYLREGYGPLPGYLFGWVFFWVNTTGSKAALSVAFAEYLAFFFPVLSTHNKIFSTGISLFGRHLTYSLSMGQLVAAAAIIFLSLCNYIGIGVGKTIQNILTVIKVGTLILVIGLGFLIGKAPPLISIFILPT